MDSKNLDFKNLWLAIWWQCSYDIHGDGSSRLQFFRWMTRPSNFDRTTGVAKKSPREIKVRRG